MSATQFQQQLYATHVHEIFKSFRATLYKTEDIRSPSRVFVSLSEDVVVPIDIAVDCASLELSIQTGLILERDVDLQAFSKISAALNKRLDRGRLVLSKDGSCRFATGFFYMLREPKEIDSELIESITYLGWMFMTFGPKLHELTNSMNWLKSKLQPAFRISDPNARFLNLAELAEDDAFVAQFKTTESAEEKLLDVGSADASRIRKVSLQNTAISRKMLEECTRHLRFQAFERTGNQHDVTTAEFTCTRVEPADAAKFQLIIKRERPRFLKTGSELYSMVLQRRSPMCASEEAFDDYLIRLRKFKTILDGLKLPFFIMFEEQKYQRNALLSVQQTLHTTGEDMASQIQYYSAIVYPLKRRILEKMYLLLNAAAREEQLAASLDAELSALLSANETLQTSRFATRSAK